MVFQMCKNRGLQEEQLFFIFIFLSAEVKSKLCFSIDGLVYLFIYYY